MVEVDVFIKETLYVGGSSVKDTSVNGRMRKTGEKKVYMNWKKNQSILQAAPMTKTLNGEKRYLSLSLSSDIQTQIIVEIQ